MNNVGSHDAGEESVAELFMSVNFTKLDRELRELGEVKVAIRRLRNGRYGKRVECNTASGENDSGRIRRRAVAFGTRRGGRHATLGL